MLAHQCIFVWWPNAPIVIIVYMYFFSKGHDVLKNATYYSIFIGKCKRKKSQPMKLIPGEIQMEENEVLGEQKFFLNFIAPEFLP